MLAVAAVGAVFLAVAAGVLAFAGYIRRRPNAGQRRVGRRLRDLDDPTAIDPATPAEQTNWLRAAVVRIGRWGNHEQRQAKLRAQLALAGYTHSSAVAYFAGARLVFAVVAGTGVAAVTAQFAGLLATLWAVAGGAAGFLLPKVVLLQLVGRRQRKIRHALPDALDIMVLGTEGGVSLQAAIDLVADEMPAVHPVLGEELRTAQREIQFGLTPGEAMSAVAARCGIAEVRDLAAAIQQGERLGASMAKTLRAYSDNARQERQVWAEEMAQKAAVKIIFPMLLCIFPAMFIVLLGPAAFQLSKLFAR